LKTSFEEGEPKSWEEGAGVPRSRGRAAVILLHSWGCRGEGTPLPPSSWLYFSSTSFQCVNESIPSLSPAHLPQGRCLHPDLPRRPS